MLTKEQINQFYEDGYVHIPEVLNSEQVSWLRTFLLARIGLPPKDRLDGDLDCVVNDCFARYPELRWLLIHERYVSALKCILGPKYVLLRETSATCEFFAKGWHKDTGGLDKMGYDFHFRPEFLLANSVFYLQDNSQLYGGGLDLIPKSHLDRKDYFALGRPSKVGEYRSLKTRAGDLVIFNYFINHRATPRIVAPAPGDENKKMALFCGFGPNKPFVMDYDKYLRKRYDYLREHCFPLDLQWCAGSHGILCS